VQRPAFNSLKWSLQPTSTATSHFLVLLVQGFVAIEVPPGQSKLLPALMIKLIEAAAAATCQQQQQAASKFATLSTR
jgi:hypothetical protein